MQIETSVDEADIGSIKTNQPVTFTVDAYPDLTFKGNVSVIRNAPTTVQNVVTYTVIVQVDNPDLKLKPGMTANVSIIINRQKRYLTRSQRSAESKDIGQGAYRESAQRPRRLDTG